MQIQIFETVIKRDAIELDRKLFYIPYIIKSTIFYIYLRIMYIFGQFDTFKFTIKAYP